MGKLWHVYRKKFLGVWDYGRTKLAVDLMKLTTLKGRLGGKKKRRQGKTLGFSEKRRKNDFIIKCRV